MPNLADGLDVGRQYIVVAQMDFLFSDLVTAVAKPVIDVTGGNSVCGGALIVETVWNSATSDVLDIGDGVDPNEYTSSQIDLTALGRTALTLTGYTYAAKDTIDLTWTGVGTAPTTGAARLEVEILTDGKAHETQTG